MSNLLFLLVLYRQYALVCRFLSFLYCGWDRFNFVGSWLWWENPGMKQGLAWHCAGIPPYSAELEPAWPNFCTHCSLDSVWFAVFSRLWPFC